MRSTGRETLIKRYGGIRLYNVDTAAYVTVDELARLRLVGRKLRVREATTGKDVTREVMALVKRAG